tara:strand:+ start:34078 stop:34947 length:870 start_codon:yes stop_codon:yes gene_type:complete
LEDKNIIVAGSTLDDGAVIWINQNKITLMGDSDEATGLFFQNEKIYVTGWKYGGAGSIWSLNLEGTDQTLIELEGQYSEGQRIILHEEDIYVGGYFKNGSCYWRNGVKFNLTTNADSMTWGIEMDSENNIYNVGYYMKSHNLIPAYWKNKQRVNLNRPRHGDGEAKYIKILGNKKIMAGTVMVPHNFLGYLTKPTYWTNGARTSCEIGSVDDGWQNSEVFDLFVDGEENIYLAGFSQDMNSEYPTYWKNCQKYILENGETTGVIRSLKVVDGKVISAGTKSYFPGTPCI